MEKKCSRSIQAHFDLPQKRHSELTGGKPTLFALAIPCESRVVEFRNYLLYATIPRIVVTDHLARLAAPPHLIVVACTASTKKQNLKDVYSLNISHAGLLFK